MEGRRVEGVFLDSAILRSKAYEAYETAKVLQIRVLTKVPEALLASLGDTGSRLRVTVKSLSEGKVLLNLENGYELEAENRLALPVKVGEELTLVLESKEPLTLRVEKTFSGMRGTAELIKRAFSLGGVLLSGDMPQKAVENSGLFYERRVWDFLRGALGREELSKDMKYEVLKALMEADTSFFEKALSDVKLPAELSHRMGRLLSFLSRGDKLSFFKELLEFRESINSLLSSKEQSLELIRSTVREVVRSFAQNLLSGLRSLGIETHLNSDVFRSVESNPKTIDVLRESLKSLEEGRVNEFLRRLELVGIRLESPERVLHVKDRLTGLVRDLVRGANNLLSVKTRTEDVQELSRKLRELGEDIERLTELKERLVDIPKGVKENLSRLEALTHLQAFMVANDFRRFVLPFRTQERRALMAFSLTDSFRIVVKLDMDGGFLGFVLSAPRKEKPDFIDLIFKTDIPELEKELVKGIESLKEDLAGLGLEVRKIEVLREEVEDFDKELVDEVGGGGSFNLRV